MKHFLALACACGSAVSAYHEVRSARVGLLGSYTDTPQLPILRRQNELDMLPQSHILFRRSDPPRSLSPIRFGSPSSRSQVTAQGPADMYTHDSRGRRQEQVSSGGASTMRNADHSYTAAWAKSVGGEQSGQPRTQRIKAVAKGRSVNGEVQPPPGGTGTIEIHSNGGEGRSTVFRVPADHNHARIHSSHPGGALVKATTDHGGLAAVTATNEHDGDIRLPGYMK